MKENTKNPKQGQKATDKAEHVFVCPCARYNGVLRQISMFRRTNFGYIVR